MQKVIVSERCTKYHICRISVFPELQDFHISRGMEILEIMEICKPENCGNT